MADTTEIEKKSLEAHVELCAERYRFLEEKLSVMEGNITSLKAVVAEVHDMLQQVVEKRNDQVLRWTVGLLGMSMGVIGWLVSHYILK